MAMMKLLALVTFIFLLFIPNYVHSSYSVPSKPTSSLFKRLKDPKLRPLYKYVWKEVKEQGREYLLDKFSSLLTSKSNFAAVLYSNVTFSYDSGLFNMKVYMGTPSYSPYNLTIDTVSELLWFLQCRDFQSSTKYEVVPCSHEKAPNYCDSYGNIVNNVYSSDELQTVGILYKDLVSFDGLRAGGENISPYKSKSQTLIFGCETKGILTDTQIPALAGLNRGQYSLASMLKEKKFIYCLPTLDSTGFISFNYPDITSATSLKYTPIMDGSGDFYFLELQSITGDGLQPTTIAVDPRPTAIVTSILFSYFAPNTYQSLSNILSSSMKSQGLQALDAETILDYYQLEHCYSFSGGDLPTTPNISFIFRGQAVLLLDNVNLLYPVSESKKVCFAFLNLESTVFNMIGSYQLTNHLVEHDNDKNQVGFAKYDDCSISNQQQQQVEDPKEPSAALPNSAAVLHLLVFTFVAIMVFAY